MMGVVLILNQPPSLMKIYVTHADEEMLTHEEMVLRFIHIRATSCITLRFVFRHNKR